MRAHMQGDRQWTDASSAIPVSTSRRSRSAATCSGGRPTSRRRSACSTRSSAPDSISSTRPIPIRAGCRATRAANPKSIIGRWIAQRGRHDDVVIATKVGSDMGLGYRCLRADYIVQAAEAFAAAPAGRCDRPLPVALGRRQDAVRRDAGGLCAADQAGQGQGDRRVQPDGGAPGAGAGRQRSARLSALPDAAAALQPVRTRELRRAARGPVRAREHRRHHVLLAGRGIPHRQVPQRGGFRQERPRRRHAEVPQPARIRDPGGAGGRGAQASTRRWRRWRWPGSCIARASPRPSRARRRSRSSTN